MKGRRSAVLAVECDFKGYDPYGGECFYDEPSSVGDIQTAVDLARNMLSGKAAFFVHTSPFMRRKHGDAFYKEKAYLDVWNEVQGMGGEIGLHPHEEEPDGSAFYYYYAGHMEKVLSEHAGLLRDAGIKVASQMTGYFGMNEWLTPIVEKLGIYVSLNNVGKYVSESHNDWERAPREAYFHSYDDVKERGASRVLEIPLGGTELLSYQDGMMIDKNSAADLRRLWSRMSDENASPCFILLRAQEIGGCSKTAESFIKYLKNEGTEFTVPSEAYAGFSGER